MQRKVAGTSGGRSDLEGNAVAPSELTIIACLVGHLICALMQYRFDTIIIDYILNILNTCKDCHVATAVQSCPVSTG